MTEEIRTASRTGGEKGVKAQRHDLLPKEGIDAIAEVFGFGASKYADHNWRKKYEWGKSYAAMQRHMTAFWNGETYDEESGLEHLAHAGFHVLVLLTWLRQDGEGSEFDDRWINAFKAADPDLTEEDFDRIADQILGATEKGESELTEEDFVNTRGDVYGVTAQEDRIPPKVDQSRVAREVDRVVRGDIHFHQDCDYGKITEKAKAAIQHEIDRVIKQRRSLY